MRGAYSIIKVWRTCMERIYLFLTACIACIIGASITVFLGLHPACMLGTIIFILAITLSLEYYFKERREKEEKLYAELTEKENALNDFMKMFLIDKPRAEKLYIAGYRNINDFRGKSAKELMAIDDINPTMAN